MSVHWGGSLAVALTVALVSPAAAAVSGYWESASEIHAIMGRNDVADALRQQPIESVTRVAPDVWELRSRNCALRATVIKDPPTQTGKRQFQLRIGRAACR